MPKPEELPKCFIVNPDILHLEWVKANATPLTATRLVIDITDDGKVSGMHFETAGDRGSLPAAIAAYRFGLRQPFKGEAVSNQ